MEGKRKVSLLFALPGRGFGMVTRRPMGHRSVLGLPKEAFLLCIFLIQTRFVFSFAPRWGPLFLIFCQTKGMHSCGTKKL